MTLFKIYSPKIEKYIKNNIAFYLGCLMWAYYIFNENINTPKELEGNYFLHLTPQELENYDYLIQVNFMENYFENFERDTQYYCGKSFIIPEKWKQTVNLYSEFLKLNEGFVKTKMTSDIKLPEMLKNMKTELDIPELINKVIQEKELETLLEADFLP